MDDRQQLTVGSDSFKTLIHNVKDNSLYASAFLLKQRGLTLVIPIELPENLSLSKGLFLTLAQFAKNIFLSSKALPLDKLRVITTVMI